MHWNISLASLDLSSTCALCGEKYCVCLCVCVCAMGSAGCGQQCGGVWGVRLSWCLCWLHFLPWKCSANKTKKKKKVRNQSAHKELCVGMQNTRHTHTHRDTHTCPASLKSFLAKLANPWHEHEKETISSVPQTHIPHSP